MMNNLRAAANHIVFKIIIGFVTVSVILSGLGNHPVTGKGEYVAKVNGQKISYTQLQKAMQNVRSRQQEYEDQQFSTQSFKEDHIQQMRQKVLLQLIDETLLDQYVDKLGLFIGDDQIKQAIFDIPAFRTENKFDNAKFRYLIRKMGITPTQYAVLMRKKLLNQQLTQGIINTDFLLPIEINRLLAIAMQTRSARIATFDIAGLIAKQNASNDEILAHYNEHKSHYLSPEAFKVSYILMDAKAIQETVKISEKEVKSWYDQHLDEFTIPARKRYSIIQSKTESEANNFLRKLQQGANFSALAKAYSTDFISAKNGGDIGWVYENESFDELNQANLSEKGQLSDVIKSLMGFLVVRLDDIAPAQVSLLSTVYGKVAEQVKQEKAIKIYHTLQQKARYAASNDNETLRLAEATTGIKAQETDWFTRDNVPTTLNYDAVKETLFEGTLLGSNEEPGSNSDIIAVDNNRAFIIRIIDHRPECAQPLQNVRAQVEYEVKRKKAIEQARIKVEKALLSLKEDSDKCDEVLQKAGLHFSAVQNFDSVNQDSLLKQTLFTLPKPLNGKSSYGISFNEQGNIALIALDNVKQISLNEQNRNAFIKQLNQEMNSIIFNTLLKNLREEAKIKLGITEIM